MASVLLVDDHSATRFGIKKILSNIGEYEVLAEAENGEQGYEMYVQHRPDIIIIDLSMPGVGGIETIRKIQSRKDGPRIIVYTMHDQEVHVRKAIEAGAMAYVLKSEPIDDLLTALEKVENAQNYMSESVAQKLAMENVLGNHKPISLLTTREYEVLCFLIKGQTVSEISKCLSISTKTVATYQTSLKKKLNIHSAVDLVVEAMKAGILELPEITSISQ